MDLTHHLKKAAQYGIEKVVKQALEKPLKAILSYTEDQIFHCTFDSGVGIAFIDYFIKFICNYEKKSWLYQKVTEFMLHKDYKIFKSINTRTGN